MKSRPRPLEPLRFCGRPHVSHVYHRSNPKVMNLLNQFTQVVANKTTRNLDDCECTVPWLSNVCDT